MVKAKKKIIINLFQKQIKRDVKVNFKNPHLQISTFCVQNGRKSFLRTPWTHYFYFAFLLVFFNGNKVSCVGLGCREVCMSSDCRRYSVFLIKRKQIKSPSTKMSLGMHPASVREVKCFSCF